MDIPHTSRHFVDVGHTNISYQKRGHGPNLVFVHGWPLNGNTWRNVLPHLDGHTCYVIDLPGAGMSKATESSSYTVRSHAEAVVQVIETLGLKDVTLVGHDSGGMICRFVAAQRPDVITALAMCGTEIPGVHSPLVRLFTLLAKMPGAKSMFKFTMSNRFLARSPLSLGGTVYDKSLLDGELRDNLLDPILADGDAMVAAVRMIRHFSNDDIDALAELHTQLTMPTLLVWGEDDPFFPVDKARDMADQFGGPTEFATIEKCKLLVHEEYPQQFAELTDAFLVKNREPIAST